MSNIIPITNTDQSLELKEKSNNKLWLGSYSDILTQYPHFDISETDNEIILKADFDNGVFNIVVPKR